MKADCHMHMVLDGANWKAALARHTPAPDEAWIRRVLCTYQSQGYTYLRDGGDRWGVGMLARKLAGEYGITYRTPGAPLCMAGHYGSFIGVTYENLTQYTALVKQAKQEKADFIKVMISGLMDFNCFGRLTEPGLPPELIGQIVHIAHAEGMAVMAHANGADTVLAAAKAGVDSVEHGAYLDREALWAMKQADVIWVPTLSTVANLRGQGRFPDPEVEKILESAMENVSLFSGMGGLIAPGSDAGAWRVPHGCRTEEALLSQAGVSSAARETAIVQLQKRF